LGGAKFVLCAVAKEDGECPVRVFIDGLQPRDRKRLVALLDSSANYGPPRNSEKCKKIEGTDGLFEFKSFQDRIPWFYDGKEEDGRGRIVMTHGFKKKGDRTPRAEMNRAEGVRRMYYCAKEGTA